MKALSRALTKTFRAPAERRPDVHRAAREEAKRLAKEHGIEIEPLRDGGMNVWPPKGWKIADPHDGDHFASDWSAALPMVRAYVMTARIVCSAASSTARIETPTRELYVALNPRLEPGDSLRASAKEMRERAADMMRRADFIEQAAALL